MHFFSCQSYFPCNCHPFSTTHFSWQAWIFRVGISVKWHLCLKLYALGFLIVQRSPSEGFSVQADLSPDWAYMFEGIFSHVKDHIWYNNNRLTIVTLWANSFYFSYFPRKTSFGISYNWSPQETVCMKCKNIFSGENKKEMFQIVVFWNFYPAW